MSSNDFTKKEQFWQDTVRDLKKGIEQELRHNRYDQALTLLRACASVHYATNQCYRDEELENILCRIADTVLPEPDRQYRKSPAILFYDGFGLNNRGLIQIYLKALCKIGHVIYVTDISHKNDLPDVLDILNNAGADILWTVEKKPVAAMGELFGIFEEYQPETAFLYTQPDDVVSTAVFCRYQGIVRRFQINLTDHAYWLGTSALDCCIEFRDYGAVASHRGRGIPMDKLVKLPFYPGVNWEQTFQGFPFAVDTKKQKVIFSGGSLYKTLGADNLYYTLVSRILDRHPEAIFWYAGSGDRSEMDKLIAQYPGRVYLTAERKDLLPVLENCFFYLSTYPITGGLMFQYAACAGKLPITLRYDSECDGYLLNQSELGIEAHTLDEVTALIDELFENPALLKQKEEQVRNAVIREEDFQEGLKQLLSSGSTPYPIALYDVDVQDLRREYLSDVSYAKYSGLFFQKKFFSVAYRFPIKFFAGFLLRLREKLTG